MFNKGWSDVDNSKEFRSIELCAGYAGIHLGLERVIRNLRTVAFVEIESFACANLVAKMESGCLEPAPIWTNLKTFNAEPFRDRIHIIAGGFPCQPFSVAGNRFGTEDERHLFPYIERTIDIIRPVAVFLENVEGIITTKTLDHRPELQKYCLEAAERLGSSWGAHLLSFLTEHCGISVLQYVKHRLEKIGYTVEAGIFSAAECGAPQQRKRVFILAYRNGGKPGQIARDIGKMCGFPVEKCESKNGPSLFRRSSSEQLANASFTGSQRAGYSREKRRGQPSTHDRNRGNVTLWPARPGQPQHEWEPPRIVENTKGNNRGTGIVKKKTGVRPDEIGRRRSSKPSESGDREIKFALGRNSDECLDRLDYAKLCESCDNRTDELRLLGNGVNPDTAEKAFITLFNKIMVGIDATT